MCLGIPARVIELDSENLTGVVDIGGNHRRVSFVLLPDVKIGDWVLIHTEFAIQTIDEEAAKEQLKLLEEAMFEDF